MGRRTLVVLAALSGVLWAGAPPAHAQVPAGCVGNRFQADLLKDRSYIRNGETVNYRIAVANNAAGACNAQNVTVQLQLPSPSGAPSATLSNLTNNAAFPFPTAEAIYGPFPYTFIFGTNPPDRWVARVSTTPASQVIDAPAPPYSSLNIDRTLQVLTVKPGLTITKVGSTTGGPAPQAVTYTYSVKNVTLPAGLPDDVSQMANVVPTDNLCSPLTLVSG